MSSPVADLRVATLGPVDGGKSTVIGGLVVSLRGNFAELPQLSEACDTLSFEDQRGVTWQVGHHFYQHEGIRFHFLDDPGHIERFGVTVSGLRLSDLILYVLRIDQFHMPLLRFHLRALNFLNKKKVFFIINGWSESAEDHSVLSQIQELVVSQGLGFGCTKIRKVIDGFNFEKDFVAPMGDILDWMTHSSMGPPDELAPDQQRPGLSYLCWDQARFNDSILFWEKDLDRPIALTTTISQARVELDCIGPVSLGRLDIDLELPKIRDPIQWGAFVERNSSCVFGLVKCVARLGTSGRI